MFTKGHGLQAAPKFIPYTSTHPTSLRASDLLRTQPKFSHKGRAVQLQAAAIPIGQPSILQREAALGNCRDRTDLTYFQVGLVAIFSDYSGGMLHDFGVWMPSWYHIIASGFCDALSLRSHAANAASSQLSLIWFNDAIFNEASIQVYPFIYHGQAPLAKPGCSLLLPSFSTYGIG